MSALLVLFVFCAPILVSAFLVLFRGKGVPGRWLFLLVGPIVVYTVLWLAMLIFLVPAWFVLTWFTPAVFELVNAAYFSPSWTAFQADRGRHFSVMVDGVSG